jgi:hypothetical protein
MKTLLIIFIVLALAFAFASFEAWIIMMLWNWIVPIFWANAPTLSFWLTLGIMMLCNLLFSNRKITVSRN